MQYGESCSFPAKYPHIVKTQIFQISHVVLTKIQKHVRSYTQRHTTHTHIRTHFQHCVPSALLSLPAQRSISQLWIKLLIEMCLFSVYLMSTLRLPNVCCLYKDLHAAYIPSHRLFSPFNKASRIWVVFNRISIFGLGTPWDKLALFSQVTFSTNFTEIDNTHVLCKGRESSQMNPANTLKSIIMDIRCNDNGDVWHI